jgi:hypothetical protein
MHPCLTVPPKNDVLTTQVAEHGIKRNPGAAIETTEITNFDGAKVAWKDVKEACEMEGLTITEVCARFRLKYPAVYARASRGKWNVISSVKKRAKELRKRDAELATSAAEWARRGDAHRELVFNAAHGALKKANLKPPRTFKEAKIADEMARRACGLDEGESAKHAVLIHINELDASEPYPIEASVIDAELSPCTPASLSQEATSPSES